jgi:signal peptidase I
MVSSLERVTAAAVSLFRDFARSEHSTMTIAVPLLLAVAMTGWVAIDADRRGRNWLAWAMLVAATGPFGFIAWVVVRRRSSAVPTPLVTRRSVSVGLATVPLLAITVMFAAVTTTFPFQVAYAEGHAMAPTIAQHDRLVVNKLAYRIGEPHVGDIAMLYYPLVPQKTLLKRVVASQGDQVRIVGGKVYRNNVLMDDSLVPTDFRSHDDWGPQVIPAGYYFVMGDHRNNSSDSRHWGFVPKKYIIGKVQLRWWPLSRTRMF